MKKYKKAIREYIDFTKPTYSKMEILNSLNKFKHLSGKVYVSDIIKDLNL